jgi:roadblock/LC7 domain-containing protein
MSQAALPDQKDVLAKLSGMEEAIAKTGLSLTDLISQHASLTAGKASFDGEIAKLKGDSTKLVAGATLPADLVAAANSIFSLTSEVATLKASAKTVDEAAAAKIVALGFTDSAKKGGASDQAKKPQTLTEKVLEAKGCKTLDEAREKFLAQEAAKPTV